MPLGLINVLSGNTQIDALLGSRHWDLSGGTTITYNFPGSASTTVYGNLTDYSNAVGTTLDFDWTTFAPVTSSLRSAHIYAIANEFNAVTSLNYTQVSDTVRADASYGMAVLGTNPETGRPLNGEAFSPASTFPGGDAWYSVSNSYGNTNANVVDYDVVTVGTGAYLTMLHEIGHSLGLKHGHTTAGGPNGAATVALPSNLDSQEFTIMSYRRYVGAPITPIVGDTEPNSFPQSLMMLDIQALQYLYGADFTTNSGNTTYTFSPTTGTMSVNGVALATPSGNRIFRTIWDGGGTDTYDLSNYTTNLTINLEPGGWSTFSSAQLAQLGGWTSATADTFARGNVANALLYNGDVRSLIENAIGGSGNDTITGNTAANNLRGNGGTDTLNGAEGNDVLVGGAGYDVLNGGIGSDTVDYTGDAASGGAAGVYVDLRIGYAQDGFGVNETLSSIENAYGTDQNRAVGLSDVLIGDDTANVFDGRGGTDYIVGNGGADYILTGDGAATGTGDIVVAGAGGDTVIGGSGATFIYGNDGSDNLSGGAGDDWLFGGDFAGVATGTDTMQGEAGNDVLAVGSAGGNANMYGGAGNDILYGGSGAAGNDGLIGGAGSDYMYGALGNDSYFFQAGDLVALDFDTILGFDAGDALFFASSYNGLVTGQQVTFNGISGSYLTTAAGWALWMPYTTWTTVQTQIVYA